MTYGASIWSIGEDHEYLSNGLAQIDTTDAFVFAVRSREAILG